LIRKQGVADQQYRNEKLIIELYQHFIMLREAQRSEIARFSDRHFWHRGYDKASYRVRLLALVRGFMGVAGYDREARGMAAQACIEAARTRDDLADIVNAGIEELLRRRRELPAFGTLLILERLLKARMVPAGVLEALADTEHWLGWTRHFGPLSGFEAKLDCPRERYLATVFCYGCGLGPSQAARSLKGLDRRHVAFANQRHITEETLDEAITGVIDAYARVGLHRHWGTGDTASADGMKWDVHPESLKSSYHIRYGGYGGIGYYLVSDTYIALFSRFLACGAYEGPAILDHLFRPDADARYKHIGGLFTAAIDWSQIEAHVPDMLRVVLSVWAGRLLPSAILRRLATYSRKNRLYFAFRELGRVIRTDFLLRYLGSVELRRAIGAATNKSKLFNHYAQWVAFGSSGLATAATRDEQRKMVKYNHLVANLLIFHTVVGMTRALDSLVTDGHGTAITPEALAGTSPYLNGHLNRFGNYELDLSKPPAPLPFELPARARPTSPASPSKAPV